MSVTNAVPWTDGHLDAFAGVRLPNARHGYRTDDVDRWLQHTAALMRVGRPVEAPASGSFRRSGLGQGYDVHHVDVLVSTVAGWQDELVTAQQAEQDAAAPEPAAADAPADPPANRSRPVRVDRKLNWTVQQRDWVRETIFPSRTGKWAYDCEEVDNFLDRVLTAMTTGHALPPIESARFLVCGRLQRGYDARAVDDFLDQILRLRPA